ncbi:hypothetical protein EMCRGX_G014298 [Ephydatia muelleri]
MSKAKQQAAAAQSPSKKEHLFKVIVVGNPGTGKTSIIKRYVHGFYSSQYKATIGVDFALKVIQLDESTVIRLQIWDIAGQERAGTMSRVYYKEAVAAFIVFDITRQKTFEDVKSWKCDVDQKVFLPDDKPVPVILLANKWDLISESFLGKDAQMLDNFCKENGFAAWFKTSAKENIGLEEAAMALVHKILEIKDSLMLDDAGQNTVDLDVQEPRKTGCGKYLGVWVWHIVQGVGHYSIVDGSIWCPVPLHCPVAYSLVPSPPYHHHIARSPIVITLSSLVQWDWAPYGLVTVQWDCVMIAGPGNQCIWVVTCPDTFAQATCKAVLAEQEKKVKYEINASFLPLLLTNQVSLT